MSTTAPSTSLRNGLLGLAALSAVAAAGLQASGNVYALMPALLAAVLVGAGAVAHEARLGTLVTSLVALGANAYLLWHKVCASGPAVCSMDSTFDCDKVNSSEWSMLFGFPITQYGAAFYVALALLAVAALRKDDDVRFHQTNALFAVVNVVLSLFLAYESKVVGAVCVMCITIYLCNGVLLWAGLRGLKAHGHTLFAGLGALLGSAELGTLALVFAVAFVGGNTVESTCGTSNEHGRAVAAAVAGKGDVTKLYAKPVGPVETSGKEAVAGSPSAAIQIVEYADYGCPHCAHAWKELKDLLAERKDVAVLYKYFPRSANCHPSLGDPDDYGMVCDAAYAAECARQQGKFVELSTQLYANQGAFAPEQLAYLARELGLDMPTFEACVAADATKATILESARMGDAAGVQGTPTFFVRGLVGPEWVQIEGGPRAVLQLLEAKDDGVALPPPTRTAQ